uniref:Uncharacterized protein n=1 Tax=Chenopodium quinoa TaxID=63459 RepID=A0A803LZT6_CHEQI
MANTTKSAFVSLALALLIMSTTLPETNAALVINGLTVNVLAIVGTCRCSPTVTSTCPICAPLSNIKIAVKLNGNVIGSANTSTDGSFKITINVGNIINNLVDVSNLRVFIELPIAGCPIWAAVSTGHLQGIPLLQVGTVLNGVATLLVPALSLVN